MKRIFVILLSLIAFSFSNVEAQNLSTEGRDFWIGFMETWVSNLPVTLEIYISTKDTTSGNYFLPNDPEVPIAFDVYPNVATRINISNSNMALGSNSIELKGINIQSEGDISVFAMNKRRYSADMAMILPTHALSTDYFVMSHWENGNRNNNDNSDSEFLIVAIEDNTQIEIIPTVNTESGHTAGTPFEITLDRGEVYQVQARADLTGTKVTGVNNGSNSCQNFALFAGNQYTQIGECGFDNGHEHLYEQMYPIKTWGREYITLPYQERSGGDVVKILAAENNTEISINDSKYIINQGEYLKIQQGGVNVITASKPVSVGQFNRTSTCDDQSGDPFLVMISPTEQLLKKVTYNAPTIATVDEYFLDIIIPTSSFSFITLDGVSIASLFTTISNKPSFSYAQLTTNGGNHTLEAADGFIAYVYGYGDGESFGYATGAGLSNLSIGVELTNQNGLSIPTDSLCLFDEFIYTPTTSVNYDSYVWQFGDGEIITRNSNDPVNHKYDSVGTYIFQLTGVFDGDVCVSGSANSEVKTLKVINPKLGVIGPRSICPNTTGVTYWTSANNFYHNEWVVSGGTISDMHNDSLIVDWHGTNANASVKLISTNQFNCQGDTVDYPVRINIELDPEAPRGLDSLCIARSDSIFYETFFTNGSNYNWNIENGEILNGQGTHQVYVNWFNPGQGKLWFDQTAVTDFTCDGTSDTLFVYLQKKPATDAKIISNKNEYYINEPIDLWFDIDSLFEYAKLYINNELYRDSLVLRDEIQIQFECDGTYELTIETYNSRGFCPTITKAQRSINVIGLKMEMLNVTTNFKNDSIVTINWKIDQNDFYPYDVFLRKFRNDSWLDVQIESLDETTFIDTEITPFSQVFEYNLQSLTSCENTYKTAAHNNIRLMISENTEGEATIDWNPYINWQNGVDTYEIYLTIDDREQFFLDTSDRTEFSFKNDSSGFSYCFRVLAIENEGNLTESWSNQACASFVPEVYVYNAFTPNDDGINEVFYINNILNYPFSRLQIIDRSGSTIYEKIGYQNDWNASDIQQGVYFYSLDLNDSRNDQQQYNGNITIIK